MIVEWSKNAKEHWFVTANYIKAEFGSSALDDFAKITDEVIKRIAVMPSCGPIEPILSHRAESYRSILFGKYSKFIYTIHTDYIILNDYWDTRQEPSQLAERI